MTEPSTYAKLSIGNKLHESVPQNKTANPIWEQNFDFLINDPRNQELQVDVSSNPYGADCVSRDLRVNPG